MKTYYKCIACKNTYPFTNDLLNCPNHNPYYGYLTVMYDYENIELLKNNSFNSWQKYASLLPSKQLVINFNEQKTPLVHVKNLGEKYNLSHLYVKDESKNPTGSFKDKGAMITINMASEWAIPAVSIVSSGNAALSIAAYAQKARITCTCFVSSDLSVGKRLLIGLYGGKMNTLNKTYEEMYRTIVDQGNDNNWNCTPGLNSLQEEGVKIIGFEIWEEIGIPDVIIAPCGNGTLLYGIYKAFKELQFLHIIETLPKIIGVQVKNAAPLKKAYEEKKDFVTLQTIPNSIAEGILAQESYSSPKVMLALADTNGFIVEVSEQEIQDSLLEIIDLESIIPEPTAAAAYAGLKKVPLEKTTRTVIINTAGGTKNLKEIMGLKLNSAE